MEIEDDEPLLEDVQCDGGDSTRKLRSDDPTVPASETAGEPKRKHTR